MADTLTSSSPNNWAAPSAATPDLMAAFQRGLPVRLIATPREALQTCRSDERLAEVVARELERFARHQERFDYLPVTDAPENGRAPIVGLIYLVPHLRGEAADGAVRDHMLPMSEDNLIGADAGILEFLRDADSHSCRLLMFGSQISGLVGLSDLQKLPVRAALFALITHTEMTMAGAIRRESNRPNEWKARLPDARRRKLEEERQAVAADDNLVDDLVFTQFDDKITIIRKSSCFTEGRTRFESEMKEARDLRDNLAHANDYATTRDAAMKVCDTVRKIERWIAHLSSWPSKQASAGD
jgi:hypothetical protein